MWVKKSGMPTGLKANDFRHESGTRHIDSKQGKIDPMNEDLIFQEVVASDSRPRTETMTILLIAGSETYDPQ
jgi:hypothetical protein